MSKATGKFTVTNWDEKPYHEGEGRKLTYAVVTQRFEGGVTGDGESRSVMSYQPDGTARYVGLQRVEGEVDGHKGSFVLQTAGTFDGTTARWTAEVIEGSGEGELEGLSGSGSFAAGHGSEADYELDFTLEPARGIEPPT
ncbi:MAG TPA: DUF3224 domain-containing protein [Candidatus Dormibacteraeota bacterium]